MTVRGVVGVVILIGALACSAVGAEAQEFVRLAGSTCPSPPALKCPDGGCGGATVPGTTQSLTGAEGPLVEEKTGLRYFLDYPCDLRPGEDVTFVLSLHGAGAPGNWHRHYFPLLNYKDTYRLVIATPYSPERTWSPKYDEYLQNVVNTVVNGIGAENIKAFWLAGHSQGGITSRRLVCTDFFRDRVDGFLSLSGGRVGGQAPVRLIRPQTAGGNAGGGGGAAPPAGAAGTGRGGGAPQAAASVDCDFSHIYTTGEHEMVDGLASLPTTSQVAERFSCGTRVRQDDVVDTKGGYLGSGGPNATLSWGRAAGPGRASVWVFPNCAGGRVVADVVRIDKGHTEGLEPNVTDALVRLMVSAQGGKIQRRR